MFALIFLLTFGANASDLRDWSLKQNAYAVSRIAKSISPENAALGAVMASPSTKSPDYYYHWVRDSALTVKEMVFLYEKSNFKSRAFWKKQILDYIAFSRTNQSVTSLGEPKFHMNGSPYREPWGRPQNDGPALRALTLIRFAQDMIREGNSDYVAKNLYGPRLPADTIIKADLEYVSHHWKEPSFDIWEELYGDHLYNRFVQYTALLEGADLAKFFKDEGAARWYLMQALKIHATFDGFFNTSSGYFLATLNCSRIPSFKPSNLDTAVLLGVLHSITAKHSAISLRDPRVVATVHKLETAFSHFPINKGKSLQLVGRYPEDTYDGVQTDKLGNAWFIAIHALAEYHYAIGNFKKGDAYLTLSKIFTHQDGSQSEQINRFTGTQQGAVHLTWNYASFLSAMRHRGPIQ